MRKIAFAVLVVVALGLLGGAPVANATPALTGRTVALASSVSGFVAAATYQGHDLSNAASASSAVSLSFDRPFTLHFSWFTEGPANGTPFAITDAVLHIEFFGQTVWTRDQTFSPAASAGVGQTNLTSDLTQNRYLFEGLLLFQVALLSDTRGTVWSESFYGHATEPYHLTVATVGLALICLFELIDLARVGPRALPGLPPEPDVPDEAEPDSEAKP